MPPFDLIRLNFLIENAGIDNAGSTKQEKIAHCFRVPCYDKDRIMQIDASIKNSFCRFIHIFDIHQAGVIQDAWRVR